jgi:hypothetical protein
VRRLGNRFGRRDRLGRIAAGRGIGLEQLPVIVAQRGRVAPRFLEVSGDDDALV